MQLNVLGEIFDRLDIKYFLAEILIIQDFEDYLFISAVSISQPHSKKLKIHIWMKYVP